jgi:hypothetical protein
MQVVAYIGTWKQTYIRQSERESRLLVKQIFNFGIKVKRGRETTYYPPRSITKVVVIED